MTRALLRRGLAPGGLGPFAYALIDAAISPVLIGVLALVLIFAVTLFGDLAVLHFARGGPFVLAPEIMDQVRIFDVGHLLRGIREKPGDPRYYWVWVMLFSTMIPSVINLAAAAVAFIRGLPWVNQWVLGYFPTDGSPMGEMERAIVALVLAGQVVFGLLLTGVGLYALGFWLLPMWLPVVGDELLWMSEQSAALNLPERVLVWFVGHM